MNIRNVAAAALTLATAVMLGACGSPSQPEATSTSSLAPEATSPASAGAARDAYELWCQEVSSKATSYYKSLADAWASIPGNRPVRCHAEVRKGDAEPQFSAADKAAINELRTIDGTQDENILFGSLVSTCAGWAGEADAQILTSEGNQKLGAVLDVCPDAPHAYDMLKTFTKPPVDSPKTATATPAPAAKSTPTPTQAATRTVTYVVETDGVIGNITYTNFIGGHMGQEQAADETPGPVSKDYVFPESDMDGGAAHGELVSLGVGAQAGAGTGSITCRILVNGREVAKQTSTGEYAVVSCNYGY